MDVIGLFQHGVKNSVEKHQEQLLHKNNLEKY